MAVDLGAIATAIATTIGTVTANGESATATARLPDQVAKLALLVYPPVGPLEIGAMKRRNDYYNFPIRLLRDPLTMPARSDAMYAWFTALRDLIETNMDLGMTETKVALVAMRMEIDGQEYASITGSRDLFDVVELIAQVHVFGHVATVSV
jgi:hypothetical protein